MDNHELKLLRERTQPRTRSRNKGVGRVVRDDIIERDGGCCLWCGIEDNLTIDHIIPRVLGGPDTYMNYQTLCMSCNLKKGERVMDFTMLVKTSDYVRTMKNALWKQRESIRQVVAEKNLDRFASRLRTFDKKIRPWFHTLDVLPPEGESVTGYFPWNGKLILVRLHGFRIGSRPAVWLHGSPIKRSRSWASDDCWASIIASCCTIQL